jgi:putative membrane protein
MSFRAGRLIVFLTALGCVTFARAVQGQSSGYGSPPSSKSDPTTLGPGAANISITDPNIVYILDQANAADSARGRLAATKGTRADVKQFGRLMAGEHHALRAEGIQLAKKLGVMQQAPPGDKSVGDARAEMGKLKAMPRGKSWDKSYIAYEVNYHQGILQGAGGLLDAAQNQQLKDLLKESGAVVQKHLDHAKMIQQKLGS